MTTPVGLPCSLGAFLTWDDQDRGRHEWDGARTVRLPDPTRHHQRLVHALAARLIAAMDPARFEVLPGMRLLAAECVLRPDIAITLAGADPAERCLCDAVVVIEVAAGDQEPADSPWRAAAYAAVPSLVTWVRLDARATIAKVIHRADGRWRAPVVVADALPLYAVGADVHLAQLRATRPEGTG